ncbi:transposase [Streptomyces netropsis]
MQILGRLRSDRVMRRPTPPRVYDPKGGRPPEHGGEFVFGDPATWGTEQAVTTTDTCLYGKATAQAWDRLHPRLTRRAAWLGHVGLLPIIEGTVIRLVVEKLPPPASGEGSETCARKPALRPVHRNLPVPAPVGHRVRRTAARPPVLATGEAFSRPAHHKVGTKPRRTG